MALSDTSGATNCWDEAVVDEALSLRCVGSACFDKTSTEIRPYVSKAADIPTSYVQPVCSVFAVRISVCNGTNVLLVDSGARPYFVLAYAAICRVFISKVMCMGALDAVDIDIGPACGAEALACSAYSSCMRGVHLFKAGFVAYLDTQSAVHALYS